MSAQPSPRPGTQSAIEKPSRNDGAPRRSKSWPALLHWVPGLLFLAAVVLVVVTHLGEGERFLARMRQLDPRWIAAAVVLQAGTYASVGAVWGTAMAAAGSRIPFFVLARLSLLKVAVDQFVPTAGLSGTIAVARRLEQRGVALSVVTSAIVVNTIGRYVAYAGAVTVSVAILWGRHHLNRSVLIAATALIVVAVVMPALVVAWLYYFSAHRPRWLDRMPETAKVLGEVPDVLARLVRSPRLLASCVGFNALVFAFDSATLAVMLQALGYGPAVAAPFAALVMGSLATTLGIVPGGLGTFEAACVTTLAVLGVPLETALGATLLTRGFTFWLPMLFGAFVARREPRLLSELR
jgi:uncharacterized membrane protein YbhN (UPF0104 family)